jgi:hypothetical protein
MVITDVSEGSIASTIRVTTISELGITLAVTTEARCVLLRSILPFYKLGGEDSTPCRS